MVVPSVAEIVAVSPAEPPVTDTVGVVSFVRLSVFEVPASLEAARSGADGETGVTVSTVIVNGEEGVAVFPEGSEIVLVTAHDPAVMVGRSHEVADPITYVHVLVVVPSVAEIVTVSPVLPPVADMVGVVSLVMLSVDDVPVSLAAARSGVPAVPATVSTVIDRPALTADVLPAGSVNVEVTVHAPSLSVGRSHEVADPITYVHVSVDDPFVAETVTVSPEVPPAPEIAGVLSFVLLSVDDVPESLAVSRSGADEGVDGAVVSTVMAKLVPAADVLPAASVTVEETVQVPAVSVGRSQELATPGS